ncbi:DUF222 domain-containing protein [Nocardioides zeae]
MGAADTGAGLVAARRLTARASALVALLVAQAEEVELHRQNGAATAAVWLANASAVTRRDAYRFARVGEALGSRCGTHLAPACEAGAVDVEQADVIVKALDALPEDLSAKLRVEAEEVLVGSAADHDARALRAIGKKILTVVAPEVGEAHEAALLEREEREARAASRLTMTSDGHGRVHGRFTLPELHGAMLRKALDAYAAPQHLDTAEDPGQRFVAGRPTPERYGQAFQQLLEMLDQKDLPATGGTGATVVVTMTLESLLGGLATAAAWPRAATARPTRPTPTTSSRGRTAATPTPETAASSATSTTTSSTTRSTSPNDSAPASSASRAASERPTVLRTPQT